MHIMSHKKGHFVLTLTFLDWLSHAVTLQFTDYNYVASHVKKFYVRVSLWHIWKHLENHIIHIASWALAHSVLVENADILNTNL